MREWVASLAQPPPRHDPSRVPPATQGGGRSMWKRSGLNARRRLARSDPPPLPHCRPLPSASFALPELGLRPYPAPACPRTAPPGFARARRRSTCGDSPGGHRPKPPARWSLTQRAGASRGRTCRSVPPSGPSRCQFAPARARVLLGSRAPCWVRPGGLGDAHELAPRLVGVLVPELEVFACARLYRILSFA